MSVAELTRAFAEERADEPLINLQRELRQIEDPEIPEGVPPLAADWGSLPPEILDIILQAHQQNEDEYYAPRTHWKFDPERPPRTSPLDWKAQQTKRDCFSQIEKAIPFLEDKHHQKHYKKRMGCACDLGGRFDWVPDFYIRPSQLKTKYFLKSRAGELYGRNRKWCGTERGWVVY